MTPECILVTFAFPSPNSSAIRSTTVFGVGSLLPAPCSAPLLVPVLVEPLDRFSTGLADLINGGGCIVLAATLFSAAFLTCASDGLGDRRFSLSLLPLGFQGVSGVTGGVCDD